MWAAAAVEDVDAVARMTRTTHAVETAGTAEGFLARDSALAPAMA